MNQYAIVRKHSEDVNPSWMTHGLTDPTAAGEQVEDQFMTEVAQLAPAWFGQTGIDRWTMMFPGVDDSEPWWIAWYVDAYDPKAIEAEDLMIDDNIKDAVLYHMSGLTGETFARDLVEEVFTGWYIDLQGEEDDFFAWLAADAEVVAEKVVKHLADTGYFVE